MKSQLNSIPDGPAVTVTGSSGEGNEKCARKPTNEVEAEALLGAVLGQH